jgi:hypothetical protein
VPGFIGAQLLGVGIAFLLSPLLFQEDAHPVDEDVSENTSPESGSTATVR